MNDKRITQPMRAAGDGVVIGEKRMPKAVAVEYGGNRYAINPNAMLTINCTTKCNAKCFFCYNRSTFMCDGPYVDSSVPQLHRALELARLAGIRTAALSGGEPTLHPLGLLELVKTVSGYGFPVIRLHTNGYRLEERVTWNGATGPLWTHLEAAGLTDLSISLADYRPRRNADIMELDTLEPLTPLLPRLAGSKLRLRLSCYLCQDGIWEPAEVLNYLQFALKMKVSSVIFRKTPSDRPGDLRYFEKLLQALTADQWELTASHQKNDALIYELRKEDLRLSFSCTGEEPDPDQKIRRLIYMPDKVLYTSWIDPASFLFEEDARTIASSAKAGDIPPELFQTAGHTIDLHVHSLVSDGLVRPTQVLERAAAAGIRKLVFTEHNCLHDSPEKLAAAAAALGMEIPLYGVEFSTVYCVDDRPHMKFHLLVYGKSADQLKFLDQIYDPNSVRNRHIRSLYEAARAKGAVSADWEDIFRIDDPLAPTAKKMFTRTPLARAIAAACQCSEEEAKDTWLPQVPDELRYQDYLDTRQIIRLAHANGCAAVLAHPGWIRPYYKDRVLDENDLTEAIVMLAREGLDGIEVIHRLNSPEMRLTLCRLAAGLDLIVTGGSDYHGKPRCCFGVNGAAQSQLDRLTARIDCLKRKAGKP